MYLYEIPGIYQELMELLDSEDGEGIEEAVSNAVSEIKENLKEHCESLGKVLAEIQAQNAACKAEEDRLKSLRESRTKKYNSIKSMIRTAMIETKETKISTSLCDFSIRKGSEITVILEEDHLPDECLKVEVVTKPVKAEIKKLIKAGKISPDIAKIVTGEPSLIIK